jgi:hypothetical protein
MQKVGLVRSRLLASMRQGDSREPVEVIKATGSASVLAAEEAAGCCNARRSAGIGGV